MTEQTTIDEAIRERTGEEETVDFHSRYVKPHNKKSREVTQDDMERLIEEAHVLYNLCYTQRGVYSGGEAVAHPQIDNTDPLRFFVTKDKEIIINPIIIRHTQVPVAKKEGCLTFPEYFMVPVERYNKCEVKYLLLKEDGTTEERIENLSGQRAQIFQHEIQHLEGENIYNKYE